VASNPLDLVGRWFVDVTGQSPGTAAVIFGEGMTVFLPCGVLDGEWKAEGRQSLFVASLSGGDQGCFDSTGMKPVPWVTEAVAFRSSGDNRLLLDSAGATVALLRPGATPTVGSNRASSYAAAPTITDAMRAAAREPAPLPAEAKAPSAQELQRRWVPLDSSNRKAHVTFDAGGQWGGSDGCNGSGGRFVLGADGRLLATSGLSTLVGCNNSPLPGWVGQASRVGLVQGDLVLYDAAGKALGRAAPA
jgi:heat shock protein HslJ